MIKKFNKLMDDIPFVFKLIIGVIMCAILTLMGLILFFFFLPEVNAAAVNPNSNQIYAEALNGDNPEYITIGQNQEYSLSVLKRSNLFVSNYINLGTGVYKGTAYVKFFNTKDESCSQLRQATNRIVLSLNDIEVQGTKQITGCTISDNYATLKIEYSYTNMTTNGVFKLIYRLPMWNIDTKYLMRSTLDYEPKEYATNTDIENQTISIINNAIQNAAEVINTNILSREAIILAMNAATTQIQNAINQNNKTCTIYDKTDIETDNKYLKQNGTYESWSAYGVSKYIKIKEGQIVYNSLSRQHSVYLCYYDKYKLLINCESESNLQILTIPDNADYIRISINKNDNEPKLKLLHEPFILFTTD